MNVVDSCGWLEYFGRGSNAAYYAPLIQESRTLVVPVICIYEVFKRILQQRGEEDALQAAGWMTTGKVVNLDQELALQAGWLSLEHKLPMADSFILAVARQHSALLWTQDEHFKDIEGVKYLAG